MERLKRTMKLCKVNCPTLPIVRKCCFCIPIRIGIAIFGYANLILSVIAFSWLIYLLTEVLGSSSPKQQQVYFVDPLVHLPIIMAVAAVDITMTVVLLIGIQKNNKQLLKTYFYFGLVYELVTLITDLPFLDFTQHRENAIYLFFLFTNIYLLFLVHNMVYAEEHSTEVQYIRYEGQRP